MAGGCPFGTRWRFVSVPPFWHAGGSCGPEAPNPAISAVKSLLTKVFIDYIESWLLMWESCLHRLLRRYPMTNAAVFFFTGPLHLSNSHTFNHGVTDIFRYSHGDLQKFENPTTIWNMDRMLALWPYGGVAHMGPLLWPQIWVSVDEWMNVAPFLYLPVWVVISGIDEYRRCRWCDLSLKSGWKNHTFSGIVHMFSGPYAVCSKSNHCDQSTRVP